MITFGSEYDWAGALPVVNPKAGHSITVLHLGAIRENELLPFQRLNTEPRQQGIGHHGMGGACIDQGRDRCQVAAVECT